MSNPLEINFFETWKISEREIENRKRIDCANYLEKQHAKDDLFRLCQLAGFLIRDVYFDWDLQIYKRELEKFDKSRGEVKVIHDFMLRHIHPYNREKYFKNQTPISNPLLQGST